MRTPTTPDGERQYDHLPAAEAARVAWTERGARPDWHDAMRRQVREAMPLLARALDRLEVDAKQRGSASRD